MSKLYVDDRSYSRFLDDDDDDDDHSAIRRIGFPVEFFPLVVSNTRL